MIICIVPFVKRKIIFISIISKKKIKFSFWDFKICSRKICSVKPIAHHFIYMPGDFCTVKKMSPRTVNRSSIAYNKTFAVMPILPTNPKRKRNIKRNRQINIKLIKKNLIRPNFSTRIQKNSKLVYNSCGNFYIS